MIAAIITVLIIIADQVSKYFIVQSIKLYEMKPFIPRVLSLYHTRNTGAAFSMLSDNRWVFMVFSFISMIIIIYLLIKEYRRHPLLTVSLAMVLGGGIGNMIDRIRLGYVVDFFHVDFFEFAVFNVADSFISVGAVLLAIYVVFFETKVEKRLQAEKAAAGTVAVDSVESAEPDESVLEPLKSEETENTPAEESVENE